MIYIPMASQLRHRDTDKEATGASVSPSSTKTASITGTDGTTSLRNKSADDFDDTEKGSRKWKPVSTFNYKKAN